MDINMVKGMFAKFATKVKKIWIMKHEFDIFTRMFCVLMTSKKVI